MRVILDTAAPFFALILCGYLTVRWRVLDPPSIRGLNAFVFWMALPALLLSQVAASSIVELLDWKLLAVFYGVNACLYGCGLLVGRLIWRDPVGTASLRSLGIIWGNYGYLGLPLLIAALGPGAALPTVAVITFDVLVPVSITSALLEARRTGRADLSGVSRALAGVVRSPLILAVAVGAALSTAQVPFPTAITTFLKLLGSGAAPCALVALGASLALSPSGEARAALSPSGSAGADILLVTTLKLFANPLLVWLAGSYLLPLPPERLATVTLLAAMPTAASVFVLAQRYETWVLPASTSVLVTHVGSVVTLSFLLYVFSS